MALSTIEQIFKCIDEEESFILDAGAGSGKTWSLVESLKYIINKRSSELNKNNQKIVCITYTNVAKDEIIERLENNDLVMVSTIHDFLWNCISRYKKELKEKLIEIIDEKSEKIQADLDKAKSTITKTYIKNLEKKEKLESEKSELLSSEKTTQYKNYFSYKNNIISHDEVITLSIKIFSSYEMIKKLIADTYPIIFVDEYQDTFPNVIKILLDYLYPDNNILFGFYGDKLQKIYDTGVGEIPSNYDLERISKEENYRCSISVIDLLNNLRDDIKQYPAGKNQDIIGSCSFYQVEQTTFNLDNFISSELKTKIELNDDNSNLKVLYLTHKLIAKENGYLELYEHINSFGKADALTKKDEDRCPFIKFLYQIENIIFLFKENKIQTLLKNIAFQLNSFDDKLELKSILDELLKTRNTKKIEDVITFVIEKNLLQISDAMERYDLDDEKNQSYHETLMKIDYNQIVNANIVSEEKTPFSTQHGTKGAEFKNVLVVIDDTAWRNYNFDKYFSNDLTNEKTFNRTKNLFYVVCSRAENNLVILTLSNLATSSETKIVELFSEIIQY